MEILKKSKLKLLSFLASKPVLKAFYFWKGRFERIPHRETKDLQSFQRKVQEKSNKNVDKDAMNRSKRHANSFTEQDFLSFSAKIKPKTFEGKKVMGKVLSTSLFDQVKANLQSRAQNVNYKKPQNSSDHIELNGINNQPTGSGVFNEKSRHRRSYTGDQASVAIISCKQD